MSASLELSWLETLDTRVPDAHLEPYYTWLDGRIPSSATGCQQPCVVPIAEAGYLRTCCFVGFIDVLSKRRQFTLQFSSLTLGLWTSQTYHRPQWYTSVTESLPAAAADDDGHNDARLSDDVMVLYLDFRGLLDSTVSHLINFLLSST